MAKHPPVVVLNAFVLNVGLILTVVYPSNTESILHFRDPCECTCTDVVKVLFGLLDFMPHVTAQDADESLLSYTVTTHKLIVTSLILCPTQLLIQQVYFPASSLLTFPIYIDLLKLKLSAVALSSEKSPHLFLHYDVSGLLACFLASFTPVHTFIIFSKRTDDQGTTGSNFQFGIGHLMILHSILIL